MVSSAWGGVGAGLRWGRIWGIWVEIVGGWACVWWWIIVE